MGRVEARNDEGKWLSLPCDAWPCDTRKTAMAMGQSGTATKSGLLGDVYVNVQLFDGKCGP